MTVRVYPAQNSAVIQAVESSCRVYPTRPDETSRIIFGNSKEALLGDRVFPWSELSFELPAGVTLSSAETQIYPASAFVTVTAGSFPDLQAAVQASSFIACSFSSGLSCQVQLTFSDGKVRTGLVDVVVGFRLKDGKTTRSGLTVKPFAGVLYASDSTYVSALAYEISAISGSSPAVAKTAIVRQLVTTAVHDSSTLTSTFSDASYDFPVAGVRVGDLIYDGTTAVMTVTALTATTSSILSGVMAAGSAFASGTAYDIRRGTSLDILAGNFELTFQHSGLYRAVLYITDSAGVEAWDDTYIKVD